MDVDASPHRIRLIAAALASCLPLSLPAAPLILEPAQTIPIPDTSFTSIQDVDIDGDSLIMTVRRNESIPGDQYWSYTDAAFLYRRASGGSWSLVRKLFEEHTGREFNRDEPVTVAMDNGLAAINPLRTMRVFKRVNDDWIAVPAQAQTNGYNLEVDSDTIIGSDGNCGNSATAYRKNLSGTYVLAAAYAGELVGCDEEFSGGDADISGTRVVIPQPDGDENPVYQPYIGVWEGFPPSAPAKIPVEGAWYASIEGDWITTTGLTQGVRSTRFYERQGLGTWIAQQAITMPDALLRPWDGPLQMDDGFVLQARYPGIEVFQRNAQGTYLYVAKLLDASDRPNVSGRTVVAIGSDGVKIYDLPAALLQPELRQDDFQDGNAADWTAQPGSSYGVVASNGSHVYRQSSVVGNAISILGISDLANQAIQADVTPTAFNGSDRWFGLITRYSDAGNYYYLTVRQSNVIQLRRIVNGTFTSLGSVSLPVSLGRTYSVRLEAIGTRLRAYVDNKKVLEVVDASHSHGQAGVMTYKTTADYDNVTVSTQDLLPVLTDDFATSYPNFSYPTRWTDSGGAWARAGAPQWVYRQSSIAGTARAITGVSTGDQSVQVDVVPTSFAAGTERWFGVIARYVDHSNYYYVTLRTNSTISLRRLVNGVIQELDSAPLAVSVGTRYRIRLDAIGNSLRVWVDGKHVLEAADSAFPEGKYGLATYKATAQFDDFFAAQP